MLRELGHTVIARDLLREAWTAERLAEFFRNRTPAECFNPTAPRIKSGEVKPESLDWPEALRAMCMDPLLIRRPLIETEDEDGRTCGFDEDDILLCVLGLRGAASGVDLQTCTRA